MKIQTKIGGGGGLRGFGGRGQVEGGQGGGE